MYPNEILEPRETENLPGIEYNPANKRAFYSEDFQKLAEHIVAIEETLGINPTFNSQTIGQILGYNKYSLLYEDYISGESSFNVEIPMPKQNEEIVFTLMFDQEYSGVPYFTINSITDKNFYAYIIHEQVGGLYDTLFNDAGGVYEHVKITKNEGQCFSITFRITTSTQSNEAGNVLVRWDGSYFGNNLGKMVGSFFGSCSCEINAETLIFNFENGALGANWKSKVYREALA